MCPGRRTGKRRDSTGDGETRPRKDRLAVLGVLQNLDELQFRLGQDTLKLLETEFSIPEKWQPKLAGLGEVEFAAPEFKTLLDDWFGEGNRQLRTAIEHASAIVYYRHQSSVPVVGTLVYTSNAGVAADTISVTVIDDQQLQDQGTITITIPIPTDSALDSPTFGGIG